MRKRVRTTADEIKFHIEATLKKYMVEYVTEYQFVKDRKWRSDYAVPSIKLLIEFEGGMFVKSRHTSSEGYTRDCDKYNRASLEKFTVLRYTTLNWANFENDLKTALGYEDSNS